MSRYLRDDIDYEDLASGGTPPTYTPPSGWDRNLNLPSVNPYVPVHPRPQPDSSMFIWLGIGGLVLFLVMGKGKR